MNYVFQFGAIAQYSSQLLAGLWITVQLSVCSVIIGTTLGIILAALSSGGSRLTRILIDAYVEVVRNTPFLVHLFLIYFGFPIIGIRIDAFTAALLGMSLNLAAYSAEIIRGGMEAIHRSQVEAGEALGFTRLQIYRHVIILPALQKVYPALCSQFVLMMLASSVCSAISTEELTAIASNVESESYRSFEVYIIVTVVYLALALAMRGALALIGFWLFGRRAARGAVQLVVEASA